MKRISFFTVIGVVLFSLQTNFCMRTTKRITKDFENQLFLAINHGDEQIVRQLVQHEKIDINIKNQKNETPLYLACKKNDFAIFNMLIDHCDLNTVNQAEKNNQTPLLWACRHCNLEMVRSLMQHGAAKSVNTVTTTTIKTPLFYAISIAEENPEITIEIVKLLLPYCTKKTINHPSNIGQTPLYVAFLHRNLPIAKLLLEHYASETIDTEVVDDDDDDDDFVTKALYWATENLEMIKCLVENGATITQKDIQDARSQETKKYLENTYTLNTTEIPLDFIVKKILQNKISQEITDLIRLSFCISIKKCLYDNTHIPENQMFFEAQNSIETGEKIFEENLLEESLIARLNQVAQNEQAVKKAILHTFGIIDENLLKKRNRIAFINHAIEATDLSLAKSLAVQNSIAEHEIFLEERSERLKFLSNQELPLGKTTRISIQKKTLNTPQLFFGLE